MKFFKRRVRISLRPINAAYWSFVKFAEFTCYGSLWWVCDYLAVDYRTRFQDDPLTWWNLFPAIFGIPALIVLFSKPYSKGWGFREQGDAIKRGNSQKIDRDEETID